MNIKEFSNKIKSINGKAYLVGGIVRDEILNVPNHDIDLVVVGVKKEDFEKTFPKAEMTGKSFPVYRLDLEEGEVEVAFARKERKVSTGHNGFEVMFDPSVTLKEDLYRRDLTMNALAKDIETNEIIDYFNGIDDINNKTINAVSEHFLEDPLRCLRTARFASKYNFNISPYTLDLMRSCKQELKHISQERIVEELKKALQTDNPSVFFNVLKETGLLKITFPFVKDVSILEKVSKLTTDIKTRFASLLIRRHVVEKMPSAYHNTWKTAALITYKVLKKNIEKPEDIYHLFCRINRSNFPIEDIKLIMSCCDRDLWYLDREFFDKVMKTKLVIPKELTKGYMIKEFVEQERIKILKSYLQAMQIVV